LQAVITALIGIGEWYGLRRRHELTPFLGAIGLFLMSFVGIAISLWPMIVPYHYTLWQAASSASTQAFLPICFRIFDTHWRSCGRVLSTACPDFREDRLKAFYVQW
jgi:cytochrome bd-type quinol oxidase subunit 2